MNNTEEKNINMNIPSSQPQEAVKPPPQFTEPAPVNHEHQTKMTFLMVITIVLGLIAVVSLVFALKMKGTSLTNVQEGATVEIEQEIEEAAPPVGSKDELDPETTVFELDKLHLELVEEDYLDSSLEE